MLSARLILKRGISSAVFLEHSHGKLSPANLAIINAARQASRSDDVLPVGVLTAGGAQAEELLSSARKLPGLSKLLVAIHDGLERPLAERMAPLLGQLQKQHNFSHWWAAHSTIGKDLMPRLAGLLLSQDQT